MCTRAGGYTISQRFCVSVRMKISQSQAYGFHGDGINVGGNGGGRFLVLLSEEMVAVRLLILLAQI